MDYRYSRHVFRDGKWVLSDTVTLSSVQLYAASGATGPEALLRLVNKWNRQGLVGTSNGGPAYVYVAE